MLLTNYLFVNISVHEHVSSKKCIDVETIQEHLEGRDIPFKTVEKNSHPDSMFNSFKLTVLGAEHFDKVIVRGTWKTNCYVREYRLSLYRNKISHGL